MTSQQDGAFTLAQPPVLADGWRLDRLTAPSRLFGANGLRTGPDGRIYIAQVTGSQISALDIDTGEVETISAKGGDIIAPDDVAFDSARQPLRDRGDGRPGQRARRRRAAPGCCATTCPSANGITVPPGPAVHRRVPRGRPAAGVRPRRRPAARPAGERAVAQRHGGRARRPALLPGDGRQRDLAHRSRRRRRPKSWRPVSACPTRSSSTPRASSSPPRWHSGQVLRIDPRTGEQTVLAQLSPGLDNCTFVGDRLFVSNFTGEITEILGGGRPATALPGGAELAAGSRRSATTASCTSPTAPTSTRWRRRRRCRPSACCSPPATRASCAALRRPARRVRRDHVGWPGRPLPAGRERKRRAGRRFRPALRRRDWRPSGIVAAELGTGRVLSVDVRAASTCWPPACTIRSGVAIDPDGDVLVARIRRGRVVQVTAPGTETVVDGLDRPQGILVVRRRCSTSSTRAPRR